MRRILRLLTSNPVVTILRLGLGVLFIYSGLSKVFDIAQFAADVANYRILPIAAVNIFAMILPWVELLCGLSLLNKVSHKSGALISSILNIVFMIAAASAMARGLDIECGCKTLASSGKVGWGLIFRDLAFLVASVVVSLHREDGPHGIDPSMEGETLPISGESMRELVR